MSKEEEADYETQPIVQSRESFIGNVPEANEKAFGTKTITAWGSFVLIFNNNTGPGMVILPLVYQQAGWFTPTFALVLICILSSFAATMMCEAMQMIPGNSNFEKRFEFATTVRYYWGEKYYKLVQILYTISMQATNIAAMIISAQVVDQLLQNAFGNMYAIDYEVWPPSPVSSSNCTSNSHPWHVDGSCSDPTFVITIGYVAVMAVCIPLGWVNLDDNMWFQWVGMIGMILLTGEFIVNFILRMPSTDCFYEGSDDGENWCKTTLANGSTYISNITDNGIQRTPFFVAAGQPQVIGVAAFTFSYVVTIPSWLNEKKEMVSVNKSIWYAASVGTSLSILIGVMAAWAYALTEGQNGRQNANDILSILTLPYNNQETQYSAYIWDVMTLVTGIPVAAIMIRYNLLSGKVCGPFWSFFWGVVSAWIITAFFYETQYLTNLCNYVTIFVSGYVNFVIPCLLYRSALKAQLPKDSIYGINDNEDEPILPHINPVVEPPVNALPSFLYWPSFRKNDSWSLSFHKIESLQDKIRAAEILAGFFFLLCTGAIIQNVVAFSS